MVVFTGVPGAVSFVGGYQRRIVDDELDQLMPHLAALLLDGPKGVGKTSTAAQRCVAERKLDHEATRVVVAADPTLIATDPRPLLIDEWHLVRPVWDVIRRLVDTDASGGQFLLTGSIPDRQTHSGAGRITSIRMRPLTLPERGVEVPTVSRGTPKKCSPAGSRGSDTFRPGPVTRRSTTTSYASPTTTSQRLDVLYAVPRPCWRG
jgi:hypothetical protein